MTGPKPEGHPTDAEGFVRVPASGSVAELITEAAHECDPCSHVKASTAPAIVVPHLRAAVCPPCLTDLSVEYPETPDACWRCGSPVELSGRLVTMAEGYVALVHLCGECVFTEGGG